MWMKLMLDPDTFIQGVNEAKDLMRLPPSAPGVCKPKGKEMPFLEYFNCHCAEPVNGFSHLINTLALAGHFLHYFSHPGNVNALFGPAGPPAMTVNKNPAQYLSFRPNPDKPDQWSEILLVAALLHDLGKTFTHSREIFNCVQHANKGYLLYHETMHLRPNLKPTPKNPGKFLPGPPERQDYLDFLNNNGFGLSNKTAQILMTVQEMILFHDRLGVWQTGESGVRPVLEALEALEKLDRDYFNASDYPKLAFVFFVLSLADMMASIPDPQVFPDRNKLHPLTAIKPGAQAATCIPTATCIPIATVTPAATVTPTAADRLSADDILRRFLTGWKGADMIRLLPDLLEPDFDSFYKDANADARTFRMIKNAARNEPAISAIWNIQGADGLIHEAVKESWDIKHIDPELADLFDSYGIWDYALDRFGDPLYVTPPGSLLNIIGQVNDPSFSIDRLKKIIDRTVALLADWLIGFRKYNIPDRPIINLEFKNHEYPYLYISPIPEVI